MRGCVIQQIWLLLNAPHPSPLSETTSHSTRLQKTAAKSLVIPLAGEGICVAISIQQLNWKAEATSQLKLTG